MSIHYQLHPNSAQLLEAQAHLNTLPNAKRLMTPINLAHDYCVAVALDGEQVIAVATIKTLTQPTIGEIGHLYVLPEYQGRGIAKHLTQMRIDYAREQGLALLYAVIKPENLASSQNLMKLGFEHFGRFSNLRNSGLCFDWYYLALSHELDTLAVMSSLTHPRQRLSH
ncbi:TPA: GNAT family N-acetyltransferase [Vibrio vulnificus]|uniref:GNAT family N-acetyltransferase n=1 Tax=Vibrio vulnificus TaxID=672 RepID=UPI0028A42A05|nr:GNAT family N-acetyltransferase [Vibrio vulnificus]HDY8050140.1 GNAT family N-acetyltransferase [Vibrio vulnificus]HDY8054720.1 GNAT family N-acetyltransferase [Vibrio vulnificus]HDY8170525.1 GNAT family N-acetyltransferase [Vibrio vulnificus]